MFRNFIIRTNIDYRTFFLQNSTFNVQKTNLLHIIQTIRVEFNIRDKMMIYNNSILDCVVTIKFFECEIYYRNVTNKNVIFQRFVVDTKINVIIIIFALKMKIDVTYIRCVIHLNESKSLLNYNQKNERANKNDQFNQTIIILNRMQKRYFFKNVVVRSSCEQLKNYRNFFCKRMILNQYLNDRTNCDDYETHKKLCEKCQNFNSILKIITNVTKHIKSTFDKINKFLFATFENFFVFSIINISNQVFDFINVNVVVAQSFKLIHFFDISLKNNKIQIFNNFFIIFENFFRMLNITLFVFKNSRYDFKFFLIVFKFFFQTFDNFFISFKNFQI